MMPNFLPSRNRPAPRNGTRSRLQCERLESRDTPSLFAGESHINTTTLANQRDPASASAADGRSVVVWTSVNAAGTGSDIYAQRFGSNRLPVGAEIRVTNTGGYEIEPTVCMDDSGAFVVAWTVAFSNGNRNIQFARYQSNGTLAGTITTVKSTPEKESSPSIACSRTGEFVITFSKELSNTNSDILAYRYSRTGAVLQVLQVTNSSSIKEITPQVARSKGSNAAFDIIYKSRFDIHLARYSATGVLNTNLVISNASAVEAYPSIGIDNAGSAVAVWQYFNGGSWDIRARRISSTNQLGATFVVSEFNADEISPQVVMHPTAGSFVVAFQRNRNELQAGGAEHHFSEVMIQEYSPTNGVRSSTLAGQYHHAANPTQNQIGAMLPAISIDGTGNFIASYTVLSDPSDTPARNDPQEGIFARRGRLL